MSDYHLRHFMAHILHLVTVAREAGYDVAKALTQVCIASDFDGIINPVWICDTVDELTYFQDQFEAAFVPFAREAQVPLPAGFDVKDFSRHLFFENGKEFVLERLE